MLAIADAAGMASPMPLTIITNLTPASGKPPKSSAKSKGKAKADSADKSRIKRDAWKADKVITILKAEGIMKDVTDIDGLLTYIRRARASEQDAARNAGFARSCRGIYDQPAGGKVLQIWAEWGFSGLFCYKTECNNNLLYHM